MKTLLMALADNECGKCGTDITPPRTRYAKCLDGWNVSSVCKDCYLDSGNGINTGADLDQSKRLVLHWHEMYLKEKLKFESLQVNIKGEE